MNGSKLSILVANHSLKKIGGSESFTFTLIEELCRINHRVEYFTFEKGEISDRIENELNVNFMSLESYDLILANHNTCIEKLFTRGFIIQTCHGIYPKLEQPSPFSDAYVSISQEIQAYLASKNMNSKIILNGINLNRFKPVNPLNERPKKILSLCHSEDANKIIQQACDMLNIELIVCYKYGDSVWNVEHVINEVDLVIGLGRSAYDAMSCGRPVIVFDARRYMSAYADGYIANVLGLSILNNCSGRYFKFSYSVEDLISEIKKYKKQDGLVMREFAVKELNILTNVNQYLTFFDELKKVNKLSYHNLKHLIPKSLLIKLWNIKRTYINLRYPRKTKVNG